MTKTLGRAAAFLIVFLALGPAADAQINKWLGIPSSGGTNFSGGGNQGSNQPAKAGKKKKPAVGEQLGTHAPGTPTPPKKKPQKTGIAPPRPPAPHPTGPSVIDILGGLDRTIRSIPRPEPDQDDDAPSNFGRPRQPRETYTQPSQPRYQPAAPASYEPSYSPPPPPAPPKNTVVDKKIPPGNKVSFESFGLRASAETDARQQVEAEKAKGVLGAEIQAQVDATTDPKVKEDWAKVVAGGYETKDVEKFIADHGGALNPGAQGTLDILKKFGDYSDALESETLTDGGKEKALEELQKSIDTAYDNPATRKEFYDTLNGSVTDMKKFNTMGQLADATEDMDNPFPPLVTGAESIGMPVSFVSEMTGLPVMPVDPVADIPAGAAASLLIFNPAETGQTVSYLLDSYQYDMAAGAQQKLDRAYTVSFDSGVGGVQKRYAIGDGAYQWSNDGATGWNLFKVKTKIKIDNSRYEGEFRYLLNNEAKTVKPGEIVEHESDLPIEIAFDAGGGGDASRKALKSGTYIVGIDPKDGRLDLFDETKVSEAESRDAPYAPSTGLAGNNATRAQRVQALIAQLQQKAEHGAGGLSGGRGGAGAVISPLGKRGAAPKSVDALLESLKKPDANEKG